MSFKAPPLLYKSIADHDSEPLSKSSKKTKSFYSFKLVPENIAPLDQQANWIEQVELKGCITIHTDSGFIVQSCKAHRDEWITIWVAGENHPDYKKYLYGISLIHKNTKRYSKRLDQGNIGKLKSIIEPVTIVSGRSKMTQYLAFADVEFHRRAGIEEYSWGAGRCTDEIISFFKKTYPQWRWTGDPLSRVICGNDVRLAAFGLDSNPDKTFHELFLEMFGLPANIFNTPFFKREITKLQSLALDIMSEGFKPRFGHKYSHVKLVTKYSYAANFTKLLLEIYGPSLPIDYIQRAWNFNLLGDLHKFYVNLYDLTSIGIDPVAALIKENIPPQSFIKMYEQSKDSTFADTIIMLKRYNKLTGSTDFPRPKRWRIKEWHDLLSLEIFKLKVENKPLPQSLFPKPVKSSDLTFFQPRDTHELAKWGAAVRNCVSSSPQYAMGVKSKKHFIVLATRDNKPFLTIQLNLIGGTVHIVQIQAHGESERTTSHDLRKYERELSKAFRIREGQIRS